MSRKSKLLMLCSILLLMFSQVSFAKEGTLKPLDKTQYVILIGAHSGSINGDELTLNGVYDAIYYTERPLRDTGNISLQTFLKSWNSSQDELSKDPPNGVLALYHEKGAETFVVEIMSTSAKDKTMTFKIKSLEGKIPSNFNAATLTINFGKQLEQSTSPSM